MEDINEAIRGEGYYKLLVEVDGRKFVLEFCLGIRPATETDLNHHQIKCPPNVEKFIRQSMAGQ